MSALDLEGGRGGEDGEANVPETGEDDVDEQIHSAASDVEDADGWDCNAAELVSKHTLAR